MKATKEKTIASFEEACAARDLDPNKIIPDMSVYPPRHHAAMIAHAKMIIITEALNDGWEPDWNNDDEYKYYPWFYMDKPGFRFGAAGYDCTSTFTTGGSRLCFRTRALAEYAGKTFIELYRDMMVIPKK